LKIISKYKDFYDYLMGIYGVDEKIVLDRRDFDVVPVFDNTKVQVFVCGVLYEGYCKNGHYYWGKDLLRIFPKFDTRMGYSRTLKYSNHVWYTVANPRWKTYYISVDPIVDLILDENKKHNCPILLKVNEKYYKFPKLNDLGLNKMISAHQIYIMLNETLAPKDNISDNLTNLEKIKSRGFDIRTSFRNM